MAERLSFAQIVSGNEEAESFPVIQNTLNSVKSTSINRGPERNTKIAERHKSGNMSSTSSVQQQPHQHATRKRQHDKPNKDRKGGKFNNKRDDKPVNNATEKVNTVKEEIVKEAKEEINDNVITSTASSTPTIAQPAVNPWFQKTGRIY